MAPRRRVAGTDHVATEPCAKLAAGASHLATARRLWRLLYPAESLLSQLWPAALLPHPEPSDYRRRIPALPVRRILVRDARPVAAGMVRQLVFHRRCLCRLGLRRVLPV